MLSSQSLSCTLRDNPREAEIVSHRLMLRTGMVQSIAPGIFVWLPMGLRVLKKIEKIIREEQNRIDAVEILAPTIQPAHYWKESGRYDDYGKEMLRFHDRHDKEMLYGPTAEEIFTHVFKTYVQSYRSLPLCLYNIQWKFRDEVRPRFGVMRGREFLMKDAYSFHMNETDAKETYRSMFQAYMRTFNRMGLKAIPVRAETGPIGGDFSHEFHIVAQTGESALYYHRDLHDMTSTCMRDFEGIYAMADDKHCQQKCNVSSEMLCQSRGIEVGHIFYFGNKYSVPMKAYVINDQGNSLPVHMGSYGIGVSRLVGAIIESSHDDKGICWPYPIAPYHVGIACIHPQYKDIAQQLYTTLSHTMDVFYYNKGESAGNMLTEMDLIGFPYQIIIGNAWKERGEIEIKDRKTHTVTYLAYDDVPVYMSNIHETLCSESLFNA